jgi:putative FmdB family regulatory protein
MPIYEYRCRKCGQETEVIQKFSDRPLQRCKECRGKLDKLISRTSFQLKGGGWYAHGYGASGSGKSSKSDSSDSKGKKDSEKKDSGKSESSSASSTKKEAAGA